MAVPNALAGSHIDHKDGGNAVKEDVHAIGQESNFCESTQSLLRRDVVGTLLV